MDDMVEGRAAGWIAGCEGGGVEAGGGEAAHKAQAPMYILLFCCLQQNSSHFISHPQPTPTPTLVSLSPVISNLQKMVSPFVPVHIHIHIPILETQKRKNNRRLLS